MKSVSRFEAGLLRLLHFFLHQAPAQPLNQILDAKLERPPCLSRAAVELVQDALAKGIVVLLTRCGAWRVERHLRGESVVGGRLWQRTPPEKLGLSFTANTLDFLMWIAAKRPTPDKTGWQPVVEPTLGDLVFLHFAYEQLRGNDIGTALLRQVPLNTSGLGWLACADHYGRLASAATPDLTPWLSEPGSSLLEALQPLLAERWLRMEIDKGLVQDWKQLRDIGRAQERVLDVFLDAIDAAGRPDLARFLLRCAGRVLTPSATAHMWTKGLRQPAPRLADRADTSRGALAFVHVLPRLQRWERRARTVGAFDEGYRASQLWKADWERFDGDELTERAQGIIRQLDPMRQTEDRP